MEAMGIEDSANLTDVDVQKLEGEAQANGNSAGLIGDPARNNLVVLQSMASEPYALLGT
jgi:hypothetical protein